LDGEGDGWVVRHPALGLMRLDVGFLSEWQFLVFHLCFCVDVQVMLQCIDESYLNNPPKNMVRCLFENSHKDDRKFMRGAETRNLSRMAIPTHIHHVSSIT
jgi:hypothetical protein